MSLHRNTIWNLVGTGLPLLVGAVTIPYLITSIGIESFGVLTLIWAIIGYFSIFDLGLGRALTQQISSARSTKNQPRIPALAKTGLSLTALTGILGGALLAALASPLATTWLGISHPLQHEVLISFMVAALGIPLTTVTSGLRGILEAYEDFRTVNILHMALGIANFGLPALSVTLFGSSLVWMVTSLVLVRLAVLLTHARLIHAWLPPGWLDAKFNANDMQKLLSFGAWMALSNILSPLMVTADRFVISAALGAAVVAYYTVPFEALIRILVFPAALTAALFPRLSAVFANGSKDAQMLYKKALSVITIVLLPICLAIALGSWWGLSIWLGRDFADHSWTIVCILALGLLLNGIAFVPFAAVQAKGDARTTAYLHLAELTFYVPTLLACLHWFGLVGAAIAWATRVGVDLLALLIIARNKFAARVDVAA